MKRVCLISQFHSQILFQADLIWAAFPEARFVFQYRDGVTWAKSFSRFMQRMNTPLLLQGEDTTLSWMMLTVAPPLDPDRLAEVLAHDSQEGTILARSAAPSGFTADNANRFHALLSRVAPDLAPDTALPA